MILEWTDMGQVNKGDAAELVDQTGTVLDTAQNRCRDPYRAGSSV